MDMLVVDWEGLSFGASAVKRKILDYLELERSDECDMIIAEAFLDEMLTNIGRCAPKQARLEITWREDGAALLEVMDLVPTIHPSGVAPTDGWRLMIASALNDALTVCASPDGHGECITAVLPIRRKTASTN